MSDWQPIETAPKDETQVLLWVPARPWDAACAVVGEFSGVGRPRWREANIDGWEWDGPLAEAAPTHWMPLPPPPTETLDTPPEKR